MELRDFATGTAICMIDCVEAFTVYRSLVQLPYFPHYIFSFFFYYNLEFYYGIQWPKDLFYFPSLICFGVCVCVCVGRKLFVIRL